ncbi:MAG: hypothetical protein QOC80_757 [Frankiaceae bacterium]|jgi:hypothetical protein|nr:hypothetical protein [Frankiaceae bacterium]
MNVGQGSYWSIEACAWVSPAPASAPASSSAVEAAARSANLPTQRPTAEPDGAEDFLELEQPTGAPV